MELRRRDDSRVQLTLTDAELRALGNGLNEALEALEDWEFSTRMGVEQDFAQELLHELGRAARELHGED